MKLDTTAPGFSIKVLTNTNEVRIRGKADPASLGKALEGMDDVTERVLSFTFEDSEDEHDVLKLKVNNSDLYFLSHPAWVKGNLVRFFFGYPGRFSPVRSMVVDSMRGLLQLSITCVETTSLVNTPRSRIWKNTSRADIVRKLVLEGVFPGVTRFEIAEASVLFQVDEWTQSRQTDWQFILKLGEKVGITPWVEGDTLHFHPRKLDSTPVRRYEYFYGNGDLKDFKISEWRLLDRPSATWVAGRDPISRKNLVATGSDENTKRDVHGKVGGLKFTRTGTGGLSKQEVSGVEGGDPVRTDLVAGAKIVPTPSTDQASVTEEADAHFRKEEENEVKATAKIIGDPILAAKSVIEIVGIGPQLSGKWYVTKHVHKIDYGGGYVGSLKLNKNALAAVPSQDQPTLGDNAAENEKKVPEGKQRKATYRNVTTGGLEQVWKR